MLSISISLGIIKTNSVPNIADCLVAHEGGVVASAVRASSSHSESCGDGSPWSLASGQVVDGHSAVGDDGETAVGVSVVHLWDPVETLVCIHVALGAFGV